MERVAASPESCFWGFLDPELPPVLKVADGSELLVEAVTHHAGDAPDLLMDDAIERVVGSDCGVRPWAGRAHHDRADLGGRGDAG